MESAVHALSGFNNKYMSRSDVNPINGVQYVNFLYWLSRCLFEDGNVDMADRVYSSNKMLHSVDLFYEVKLPSVWSCEHPLGAVMGRAFYGNRFFFYQGCTVGGNRRNGRDVIDYPKIGDDVIMYSNSKILGNSCIGDNVILSANAYIINESIPNNCIVFGQSPHLTLKEKE